MAGAEERPKEESRGSGESKLSLVLREPREIERGVAEQLVEMFRKQPKTEWSKLVGYSAEWTEVRIYTRGIDFCSAAMHPQCLCALTSVTPVSLTPRVDFGELFRARVGDDPRDGRPR